MSAYTDAIAASLLDAARLDRALNKTGGYTTTGGVSVETWRDMLARQQTEFLEALPDLVDDATDLAVAASLASGGPLAFFSTYSAFSAAVAGLADGIYEILADESHGGAATRYTVASGVATFQTYLEAAETGSALTPTASFADVPDVTGRGAVAMRSQAQALTNRTEFLETAAPVDVRKFGVALGADPAANTDALQSALQTAANEGFSLSFPGELYGAEFSGPVYIDHTMVNASRGVSMRGQSNRGMRILYSGSGFFLNITGSGLEGDSPITRFQIERIWIDGQNNTISDGGIYIDRAYIFAVLDSYSTGWAKSGANALQMRNVFNARVAGGNYSNSSAVGTGGSVIVVGSKNSGSGDTWNTSNVQIQNLLCQRGGRYGIEVVHDGNIFDNLHISDVSLGQNAMGSIYCHNANVNQISIESSHFESAGYNGTGTPADANHIDIQDSVGVSINCNEFKDAKTHVKLHRVKAFQIGANKNFESGAYTIASSTGYSITGESGNGSQGIIMPNNLATAQIDTPYVFDQYSSVNMGSADVESETSWSGFYASKPSVYGRGFVRRQGISADKPAAFAKFDKLWTAPDLTNWLRVGLFDRAIGSGNSFPESGTYTQGDFYLNNGPAIASTGEQTVTLGWFRLTTGSGNVGGTDWQALRVAVGSGDPIGRKVSVPATSSTAGHPGEWAADGSYFYVYTGDGSTHSWRRATAASW